MSSRNSYQPDETAGGAGRETVGLFKDILGRGLDLRVRVTGGSMAPFLRGGEIVTVRKVPSASLRRGDLILFKHPGGSPKIHRVIKKMRPREGFITKGDALAGYDAPVGDADILGKVCAVERARAGSGTEHIDMESLRRRAANGFAALAQLLKTEGFNPALRLSRLFCKIRPDRYRPAG